MRATRDDCSKASACMHAFGAKYATKPKMEIYIHTCTHTYTHTHTHTHIDVTTPLMYLRAQIGSFEPLPDEYEWAPLPL